MISGKSELKIHEWLAVALMIGVLLSIALITTLNGMRSGQRHLVKVNKDGFDVLVKGAVVYPGIYHLPHPMYLQEILDLAVAKDNANLQRFRFDTLVSKGRVINIPQRSFRKKTTKKTNRGTSTRKVQDALECLPSNL